MGSIPEELEGDTRPQTPSDRDTGWLRRKANYEKASRLIGGKSFMVANSSGDGTLNSLRNESTKGSHKIKNPLKFHGVFCLVVSGWRYK